MLFQRGRIWWFEFNYCGRRIQKSTKETNRNRAATVERGYRNRLADAYNVTPERKAPIPFSVAADRLIKGKLAAGKLTPKGVQRERGQLAHLLPTFGSMLLTDITATDVNEYIGARLAEGAAAKTVTSEIGSLRVILRKHRLWGNLQPDIELPRVSNEIGRALDWQEEADLLRECAASRSRSLLTAVVLDLCVGLRRDELRLLRWVQIDLERRSLRVGKAKTAAGEGRVVPLNGRAMAILTQWAMEFPGRKPQHFIFPLERYGRGGAYATDPTRPIGSWKEAWEAAKLRAGVECRWHDLRHTACTRMVDGGTPLRVVAVIMGWAPSTEVLMARRYAHPGQAACAEAVKSLNGPGYSEQGLESLQNSLQSDGGTNGRIQ